MRRIDSMRIVATLLGLFMLFGMPAVSADAGTITVCVDDIDGAYGDTIDVPINVSGASDVGAMDIALTYNSSVLSPTGLVCTGDLTAGALVINDSTIYPDPVTGNDTISEADNQTVLDYGALANHTGTSGVVNISIICNADGDGVEGAGSVVVVRFAVTGTGDSPLDLSVEAYNVSAPIMNTTDPSKTDSYENIAVTTDNGTFGTGATHIISLEAGWNLISIPVIPDDASVDAIFGDNITKPVYEYNSGYNSVTNLEPKKGYWVLANAQVNIDVTGTAPTNLEVTVYPGWNLIGPVSSGVQVGSFDNVTLPVYGYDSGYKSATTLEQTKGYWVLASAETTLTV